MKISSIHLNEFKRFTHTSIANILPETKLVVIAGPNGCGKSSLIEAAHYYCRQVIGGLGGFEPGYHVKQMAGARTEWNRLVDIRFHGAQPETEDAKRKAIYARSAYRNEPAFALDSIGRTGSSLVQDRLQKLIDNDATVSRNYRRLVSLGIRDLYTGERFQSDEYRERSIGKIQKAMGTLFPGLEFTGLGDPLARGTFTFSKGQSTDFSYQNLSGGEKGAFDLLLDLVVKLAEFDDTVYFVDGPEAHMSPHLQAAILGELFSLIPD